MKSNPTTVKTLETAIKELKDYVELEKVKNRLTVTDVEDLQSKLIENAKQKILEVQK